MLAAVPAAVLAGLAVAALGTRPRVGARRLAGVAPRQLMARRPRLAPTAACGLAALGLVALFGLRTGAVLGGLVLAAGPHLAARLEPRAVRAEREQLLRDLPLTLDLLAACLTGGASPASASTAVGSAVGGACGRRLGRVAAALSVGSSGPEAWALLADGSDQDPLAPAARMLARAADGGAPVAATVGLLAADARATARAAREQAGRRVGVLVVAPLGLCFLPAFVLVGIVPVVLGLAAPLIAA